jgi:hypothetical protein
VGAGDLGELTQQPTGDAEALIVFLHHESDLSGGRCCRAGDIASAGDDRLVLALGKDHHQRRLPRRVGTRGALELSLGRRVQVAEEAGVDGFALELAEGAQQAIAIVRPHVPDRHRETVAQRRGEGRAGLDHGSASGLAAQRDHSQDQHGTEESHRHADQHGPRVPGVAAQGEACSEQHRQRDHS